MQHGAVANMHVCLVHHALGKVKFPACLRRVLETRLHVCQQTRLTLTFRDLTYKLLLRHSAMGTRKIACQRSEDSLLCIGSFSLKDAIGQMLRQRVLGPSMGSRNPNIFTAQRILVPRSPADVLCSSSIALLVAADLSCTSADFLYGSAHIIRAADRRPQRRRLN